MATSQNEIGLPPYPYSSMRTLSLNFKQKFNYISEAFPRRHHCRLYCLNGLSAETIKQGSHMLFVMSERKAHTARPTEVETRQVNEERCNSRRQSYEGDSAKLVLSWGQPNGIHQRTDGGRQYAWQFV